MTPRQIEVLRRAAARPEGFICPTPGLRGAAQTACIVALRRLGYVTMPGPALFPVAPRITEAGRKALAELPSAVLCGRCGDAKALVKEGPHTAMLCDDCAGIEAHHAGRA